MEQGLLTLADEAEERLDDEARLNGLRRPLAYGTIDVLVERVERHGDALSRSRFPEFQKEFYEIKKRAEEGLEIEASFGRGALLNIEHPFVQRLAREEYKGALLISPQMIEAALRYRCRSTVAG